MYICFEGFYGSLCFGMCNCFCFEVCYLVKGCINELEYYNVKYGKVYFMCFVFIKYNFYG